MKNLKITCPDCEKPLTKTSFINEDVSCWACACSHGVKKPYIWSQKYVKLTHYKPRTDRDIYADIFGGRVEGFTVCSDTTRTVILRGSHGENVKIEIPKKSIDISPLNLV